MKLADHLQPLHFEGEHGVDFIGYLLLICGVLAVGVALTFTLQTAEKITAASDAISNIQNRQHAVLQNKVIEENPEAQAMIEKISQQARYPWSRFFSTLEAIHTREVSLIAIQPNFEKKQVLMTAEAESLHQMLMYIRRFEQQQHVERVELLSQELMTDDAKGSLSFSIMAVLL